MELNPENFGSDNLSNEKFTPPPDLTNGIKNFYFSGTDSFGMLKHYSGN
jgi:hypothetical protein